MDARLRINVNQLTLKFLNELREKYANAELEIKVNRNPDFVPLSENDFWAIIELLDWKKEDNELIVRPVIEHLKHLPLNNIFVFEDILSEKLYELDQRKYAEHIGMSAFHPDQFFSVDNFLYARACVIANGKTFFQQVINNPKTMPKNLNFEPLLYVAMIAYEEKTGKEFSYLPKRITETFSNKQGWK